MVKWYRIYYENTETRTIRSFEVSAHSQEEAKAVFVSEHTSLVRFMSIKEIPDEDVEVPVEIPLPGADGLKLKTDPRESLTDEDIDRVLKTVDDDMAEENKEYEDSNLLKKKYDLAIGIINNLIDGIKKESGSPDSEDRIFPPEAAHMKEKDGSKMFIAKMITGSQIGMLRAKKYNLETSVEDIRRESILKRGMLDGFMEALSALEIDLDNKS